MEPNYVYRDGNGQPTDEPSLRAAYADELEAEVVKVSPPEPTKAEEIIISETDRLKAENFSLRIQNLAFQRQNFIEQANRKVGEFDTQIMETRNAIVAFQAELNVRYGIDFSKYAIEPGTGRVIPGSP